MTGLEAIKGKYAIKVAEYNSEIAKTGTIEDTTGLAAIGFQIPSEEDEYYEED